MAQLCIIQPTTAEVAYTDGPSVDSARYASIVVSADALGVAGSVDIYMVVGNQLKALIDDAGVAQTLTPTVYMRRLLGGPTYVFAKSATTGACGLYIDFCA